MRLTKKARQAINKTKTRQLLGLALDRSEQRIIYLLKENKDNTLLTTAAALRIIKQETGLKESEILEEDIIIHSNVRVGRQSKTTI